MKTRAMKQHFEREQEDLLHLMEQHIDPSLQKIIAAVDKAQKPCSTITVVTSRKGTSNADPE